MKITAAAFAALAFLTSEAGARESTLLRVSKTDNENANPAAGADPIGYTQQCVDTCSHKAIDKFSPSLSMDVEEARQVRLSKNDIADSIAEEVTEEIDECAADCVEKAVEAATRSGKPVNRTAIEGATVCFKGCSGEAGEEYGDEVEDEIEKELKGDYGKNIDSKKDCDKQCEKTCKGQCNNEEDEDCMGDCEDTCVGNCEEDFERAVKDAEKDAAKKAEKAYDECTADCREGSLPFLYIKTKSSLLRASKVASSVGSDSLGVCIQNCGNSAIKDFDLSSVSMDTKKQVLVGKNFEDDVEDDLTEEINECLTSCATDGAEAATRSGGDWNATAAAEATACASQCATCKWLMHSSFALAQFSLVNHLTSFICFVLPIPTYLSGCRRIREGS
jgi:hypothetical protein